MKFFIEKISVKNYNLAMAIAEGLENAASKGKYECVIHENGCGENYNCDICVYYAEPKSKTPIGFDGKEDNDMG